MQKALELTLSIPQRATDLIYINNIEEYPGDVKRLGRLYRHVFCINALNYLIF